MYKVGDSVIIHPLLCTFDRNEPPSIIGDMLKYAGTKTVITEVNKRHPERYYVYGNSWWWHEKWLLPDENELKVEEDELIGLVGD